MLTITNNLGSLIAAGQASYGAVNVNGGTMTLYTKLLIGNCPTGGIGVVSVTGGDLFVTNAAHSAVVDVHNGQVTLAGGTLQVDKLVLTNSCSSSFLHPGARLSLGAWSSTPIPSAIVSVTPQGNTC